MAPPGPEAMEEAEPPVLVPPVAVPAEEPPAPLLVLPVPGDRLEDLLGRPARKLGKEDVQEAERNVGRGEPPLFRGLLAEVLLEARRAEDEAPRTPARCLAREEDPVLHYLCHGEEAPAEPAGNRGLRLSLITIPHDAFIPHWRQCRICLLKLRPEHEKGAGG